MRVFTSAEEILAAVGTEIGKSEWLTITQERVNQFAEATGDHQWIHLDVERAKKHSPYGGTIAHGFLTLSLVPFLSAQIYKFEGAKMGINYGSNKVRFPSPVLVGSAVQLTSTLSEATDLGDGALQNIFTQTISIEGASKPALVLEMVTRVYFLIRRLFAAGLVLVVITIGGCGDESASADRSAMNTMPSTSAASTTTPAFTPTPAQPVYVAPFIDRVEWATTERGPSLQVFPTEAGRYVVGETELDPAWAEVVALDPTADSPGMREQFACHWRFARIVAPDKTSWNLEPWRPVVTDQEMVTSRCNPGGAEEQIP